MNNLIIVSGITVSLLIVILLFKLNKTKIEYDNKLLVLNRKVRDLTNLIDLSNTKSNLLQNQDVVNNEEQSPQTNNSDILENNSNVIDNEYQQFVQNNGNFFENLDTYDAPISQDVKNDIDNLLNSENFPKEDENRVNSQNTLEEEDQDTTANMQNDIENASFSDMSGITSSDNVETLNNGETEHVDATEELQQDELGGNMFDANNEFSLQNELESSLNELSQFETSDNIGEFTTNLENVEELQNEVEDLQNVEVEELQNVEVEDLQNIEVEDLQNVEVEDLQNEASEHPDVVNIVLSEVNTPAENITEITLDNDVRSLKTEELDSMSVKALQEVCRNYKIKVKGRKDELVDRIKEYLSVDKL